MAVFSDEGLPYTFGPQLARDAQVKPYASDGNVPTDWRALWVYAIDSSLSRSEGERAKVNIPYEPVSVGPQGGLFSVDTFCPEIGRRYKRARLDEPDMLRNRGVFPDESDARFHGQMAYAIACLTYEAFRDALGRMPSWAFDPAPGDAFARLTLHPFAMKERNAYYSRNGGCVQFGYFATEISDSSDIPPGKLVFSALSSDIIAHEVGHALLDGMRPYFAEVTRPDVPAFHEAFSDLLAMFQRFRFRDFIRSEIVMGNGELCENGLIGALAPQFGAAAMLKGNSVRTYMTGSRDEPGRLSTLAYDASETSPHKQGSVLAGAVLDAFFEIIRKRVNPLIRIRTGGRDVLEKGELSADLLQQITYQVQRVAAQFRAICIRAIDYCPPIDIDFGDYLRALVTADHELVPNDRYGYREEIICAFRRRGIYPESLPTMSETALLWNAPRGKCRCVEALSLQNLAFQGDPGDAPDLASAEYNARKLGDAIMGDPDLFDEIGLLRIGHGDHGKYDMGRPEIASLRATRRGGPDGQISFNLVAEVLQSGWTRLPDGRQLPVRNGATLILDEDGTIRYVIRKRMTVVQRHEGYRDYIATGDGATYWQDDGQGRLRMHDAVFARLCGREAHADLEDTDNSRDIAANKSWVVVECDGIDSDDDYELLVNDTIEMKLDIPRRLGTTGRTRISLTSDNGSRFRWRGEIPTGHEKKDDPFLVRLSEDGRD